MNIALKDFKVLGGKGKKPVEVLVNISLMGFASVEEATAASAELESLIKQYVIAGIYHVSPNIEEAHRRNERMSLDAKATPSKVLNDVALEGDSWVNVLQVKTREVGFVDALIEECYLLDGKVTAKPQRWVRIPGEYIVKASEREVVSQPVVNDDGSKSVIHRTMRGARLRMGAEDRVRVCMRRGQVHSTWPLAEAAK